MVVRAGSGDDPTGKFGTASLTAAMLDEGAGTRSALEMADAVEFLGATLSTSSSFDASAVRLNVPVQRLQDGLPLLADVVLRPTFPETEVERLRQERLTSLLQARDDPSSIAAMAFARVVFGLTHRYGTGTMGTEATVKSLLAGDLENASAEELRIGSGGIVPTHGESRSPRGIDRVNLPEAGRQQCKFA